jgi:hypothetical protein
MMPNLHASLVQLDSSTGDRVMRIALASALAVVVATPVLADAPIEWVTRFAFLHAVKAERLPPGPESWKAFACVAKAARPISDRDPTQSIRNRPIHAEADEAIAPCKAEMDAIPKHAANMQDVAVDLIAKFRADRPRQRP